MTKCNLILLGAPGSGKGTQAKRLVEEFGYGHVSTGDLLRAEIAKGSSLGNKVKGILDKGQLVDDETVLDLLIANLDLENKAYIFDGFPRNLTQAKLLGERVLGGHPFLAVFFDIDLTKLVGRITNRRIAPKSGRIYNLISNPPKVAGKCDESGEDLIHRPDDSEKVVLERMKIFEENNNPIVEFYKKTGNLRQVDANLGAEDVWKELSLVITES